MATVKSVQVTLRTGIDKATLPNNITMKQGVNYLISLDDFAKISQVVRDTVITATPIDVNTKVPAYFDSTNYVLDLTHADVHNVTATFNASGQQTAGPKVTVVENLNSGYDAPLQTANRTEYFDLGQVIQGFGNDAFMLVKLVGADNATTTQNVAVWSDKAANEVSVETDAVALATADFAGVVVAALTSGNWGWIQISGLATAAAATTDVAAGEVVKVSRVDDIGAGAGTAVGRVRSATNTDEGERKKITLGNFGTDEELFGLTYTNGSLTGSLVFERDDAGDGVSVAGAALNAIAYDASDANAKTATAALIKDAIEALDPSSSVAVVVNGYDWFTVQFFSPSGDLGNILVDSDLNNDNTVTITEDLKGSPTSGIVGTALTAVAADVIELEIRSNKPWNRHTRRPKFFFDK